MKNADLCVWLNNVKADVAFNVGQIFFERNRLAAGRKLRELCLDYVVGKLGDIIEACSKVTYNQYRLEKDGVDGDSPRDRAQARLVGHSRLVVSAFGEEELKRLARDARESRCFDWRETFGGSSSSRWWRWFSHVNGTTDCLRRDQL